MEMIQVSPKVSVFECLFHDPSKVVSLWVLIEWRRPRASLMESYGDCWAVRSYKADSHNGALKAMMCTQCHVTPMRSYMVRPRRSRVLIGTDHTHGATHSIGCPSL